MVGKASLVVQEEPTSNARMAFVGAMLELVMQTRNTEPTRPIVPHDEFIRIISPKIIAEALRNDPERRITICSKTFAAMQKGAVGFPTDFYKAATPEMVAGNLESALNGGCVDPGVIRQALSQTEWAELLLAHDLTLPWRVVAANPNALMAEPGLLIRALNEVDRLGLMLVGEKIERIGGPKRFIDRCREGKKGIPFLASLALLSVECASEKPPRAVPPEAIIQFITNDVIVDVLGSEAAWDILLFIADRNGLVSVDDGWAQNNESLRAGTSLRVKETQVNGLGSLKATP